MNCYETPRKWASTYVPIVPPVPIEVGFSPFGNIPSLMNKWPRKTDLYTVQYEPHRVKYGPPIYAYGGVTNCGNNLKWSHAYACGDRECPKTTC